MSGPFDGGVLINQPHSRVEETVRALAAATAAVRLYPPTSEIPRDAIARFVSVADATTSGLGPVRLVVEPKNFKYGETVIGEGHPQLSGLAETLYAHQIGQLIIAPGVTPEETTAFLHCASSDAAAVREEGGLRAVTVSAGVEHLAVIELTLRASTEEGLLGLDLTSAPLDAIGPEVVRAAADWARSGAEGEGNDVVAGAIDRLEPAARDMARQRIAEALMQLDEQTRAAVLAAAERSDTTGAPMQGMLEVVARMKPAALARLLKLAAARSGGDADALIPKLELPPEAARALALMLRPSPRTEAECGVPPTVDVDAVAAEALVDEEGEEERLRAQVAASAPAAAAARALKTTLAVVGPRPTPESVDAIGDAVGPALKAGAFGAVHDALTLLEGLPQRPELEVPIARVRQAIAHGESLSEGLATLSDPGRAPDAAAVVAAAGATGADALLETWQASDPHRRAALEPVIRALPEQTVAAAGRRFRGPDAASASDLVGLLGRLGDRRAVPALAQALDHGAPEVRAAAVKALALQDTPESWGVVASALSRSDEQTALLALAEIRAARPAGAVPALVGTLESRRATDRSWMFRRETIECVREMRATEAVPALKREAKRLFAFGQGARSVRQAARDALTDIGSRP